MVIAPNTIFQTAVRGTASLVELRSQFLLEKLWLDQVLLDSKKVPSFMELMALLGKIRRGGATNKPILQTLETSRNYPYVTVDAQAQPAIGANIILTVAAGNYGPDGISKVQEQTLWVFPDGTVGKLAVGDLTRVPNADTIELSLHLGTRFPAVVQGTTLLPMSWSFAELEAPTASYVTSDVRAYDHRTQLFRGKTEVTHQQLAFDQNGGITSRSVRELMTPWASGATKCWTTKEVGDWYDMEMVKMNLTMLMGVQPTNPGAMSLANARYTDGLLPAIKGAGMNFITPLSLSMADFRFFAHAFTDASFGDTQHDMMCGLNYWNLIQDFLITLPGQTTRQGVGNRGYTPDYDSLSNINAGHNFSFTMVEDFSSSQNGLKGLGYEDACVFLPSGTTADTLTGEQVPLLELVYQAPFSNMDGGIGDGMIKWATRRGITFADAQNPRVLTDDLLEMEYTCTMGHVLRQLQRYAISM
jgi:hypothetical protein